MEQVNAALHAAFDRPDVPLEPQQPQPQPAATGAAGADGRQLQQQDTAAGGNGGSGLRSVDRLRDQLVDQVGGASGRRGRGGGLEEPCGFRSPWFNLRRHANMTNRVAVPARAPFPMDGFFSRLPRSLISGSSPCVEFWSWTLG